jgi:2-polyprenyl-6-methoxyphenol hydroxylase-like FAD-dependent oxidoreductase
MAKREIVGPTSRVGIVGGGLAGVTAAAALIRRRIKVTLFEQKGTNFPIQRHTAIRFVHPTINFWPEMKLNPSTDLPLLSWTADICAGVIRQIERQWSSFEGQLTGLHRPWTEAKRSPYHLTP